MSLISCQVFSNLIRHYRRNGEIILVIILEIIQANGGFKKVLNKTVTLIVANVY